MADLRTASSQLLTQLLSVNSPELGARLKQRLNSAFIASGMGVFDEKSLGFSKFTDYLLRTHGDLVSVTRQEGIGDILVSLRAAPTSRASVVSAMLQKHAESAPVIRSEVWQAFANPDPERKRFFNKQTGKIVHYPIEKSCKERAEVESSPDNFLEIPPISKAVQAEWMKEFLGGASLPAKEKEVLEPLTAEQYSSTVNAAFSRALGAHSVAWRNFRTVQVISIIEKWASDAGISLSELHRTATQQPTSAMHASVAIDTRATQKSLDCAPTTSAPFSPRQQVLKLLDLVSDDDIAQLVLPTLLSTILIKSRL